MEHKNRIGKQQTGFRKGAGFFALAAALFTVFCPLPVQAAERLQDVGEKLVVVIDPGHGGENEGTKEGSCLEKEMDYITAMAMCRELMQYDGVEVYLTRTEDQDMSLAERAAFAASVEADFLFSIHYNASENHELFGSEVWVSGFAPFNGYGYQYGQALLPMLRQEGLFIRGIKTRFLDNGDNYYGIIRESEAVGVPAVIIEHCHVDEARDQGYCDPREKLEAFGRMDAEAAAQYFGLTSSALGVDYSGYSLAQARADIPQPLTVRDETPPEICELSFLEADYGAGSLSFLVSGADYDTPLLYYSYSLDGGQTYSSREPWPGSDALTGSYTDTFTLQLEIPSGATPQVILRAYNLYDLYTESAPYISPQAFETPGPEAVETAGEAQNPAPEGTNSLEPVGEGEAGPAREAAPAGEEAPEEVSVGTFLKLCLAAAAVLLSVILFSQLIAAHGRRKRRQRRKDSGTSRNQRK